MGGACGTYGGQQKYIRILVGRHERSIRHNVRGNYKLHCVYEMITTSGITHGGSIFFRYDAG
jgi:hypothetical protein